MKIIKVMGILFIILAAIIFVIINYVTNIKVDVIDTAQNGEYIVVLQSVGEPDFPFGSASGQLVLKKGETIISETDFEIANDGGYFSANSWSVMWFDDYVEITLSGEEQLDELVTLNYNGEVYRSSLTTHYGVQTDINEKNTGTDFTYESTDEEKILNDIIAAEEVSDGYKAIYELISDGQSDNFEIIYMGQNQILQNVFYLKMKNQLNIWYMIENPKMINVVYMYIIVVIKMLMAHGLMTMELL